jgi:hypothetical protein
VAAQVRLRPQFGVRFRHARASVSTCLN